MEKKEAAKPVISVKLVTGKENIMKAIKEISVTGKTLEVLIHNTACSVLAHIEKHREVSLANQLVEAIPNLARKNALRDWFVSFGQLVFDEETKLLTFKKTKKTNQAEANQNPFWLFKPEAEYKPFDLNAAITNLVSIAKARQEKGNKKDNIPNDKLVALSKIVA